MLLDDLFAWDVVSTSDWFVVNKCFLYGNPLMHLHSLVYRLLARSTHNLNVGLTKRTDTLWRRGDVTGRTDEQRFWKRLGFSKMRRLSNVTEHLIYSASIENNYGFSNQLNIKTAYILQIDFFTIHALI